MARMIAVAPGGGSGEVEEGIESTYQNPARQCGAKQPATCVAGSVGESVD